MVGSGQTEKVQPELLKYNFWRKYMSWAKEAGYLTHCLGFMSLTHSSIILSRGWKFCLGSRGGGW